MATATKIRDVVAWALPQVGGLPLNLNVNQPALGFANIVQQIMLAPPLLWNWNRGYADFVTVANCQNYCNVNAWAVNPTVVVGQVVLDSNGNAQKCVVAGATGGSAPTWATGMFATTVDGTVTWQNTGALTSIYQVPNFGFIDKAYVQDVNSTPVQWKEMKVMQNLSRASSTARPEFVAAVADDNQGDIAFRLMPVPGAAYPVSIEYMGKPSPYESLGQSWAPIPDHIVWEIAAQGFLALAQSYAEDPRYPMTWQHFLGSLLAHQQGLTDMQKAIFLETYNIILLSPGKALSGFQQGSQGRQIGG